MYGTSQNPYHAIRIPEMRSKSEVTNARLQSAGAPDQKTSEKKR
jgi:hypothetical protein